MKYKLSLILLVLTLTACTNIEQIESSAIITEQTDFQLNNLDKTLENEEIETVLIENSEQTKLNELKKLINQKRSFELPNEVPASFFVDMDYLFLVQEEVEHFDDGGMPWYEYALLGGSYDTYEKGIHCYNEVNTLYEKWQVDRDFNVLKERFPNRISSSSDNGFINQYYRRHIAAFSPNADRILLKTYINPPYQNEVFYEIYEYEANTFWPKYSHSYIYQDIIYPYRINYTKGLQFATLENVPVFYYGNIYTFYETSKLSNYYDTQDAKQYDISLITDSNDTLFYKADVNSQGNKCIGIYSISDNKLIFQSEAIEHYPDSVDILDDELIAGFSSEPEYNYIKINMETKEANYLFTSFGKGSFSPDGKYFAYPATTREYRGYNIYSVATGEQAFIETYDKKSQPLNYIDNNNILCWVKKDKIEEIKENIGQAKLNELQNILMLRTAL